MIVMKRSLITSVAGCLILIASCKRTVQESESGEPEQKRARKGDISRPGDRLGELRAGLQRPKGPDDDANQAVQIMGEFFRKQDRAGLKELEKLFKEQLGLLRDGTGAEFMELLKPEEWQSGLEFVGGIQDDTIRLSIQAAMIGRAMTTNSIAALELFREFKPVAPEGLVIDSQPFDFERMVWFSTGLQTVEEWNKRPVDRQFISSLAGNPKALDGYAAGLNASIRAALDSGVSVDFGTKTGGLPAAQQSAMARSLASTLSENGKNASVVGQLIHVLGENHEPGSTYLALGRGVSREVFHEFALTPSSSLEGGALESFVSGWVSLRPKDSVAWIISKTTSPEILKPAFSSWAEIDSMEASQWLQSQPAGPIKDACTEQLCDYLLKKGSTEEAKGYLNTLPADIRERLAARYPGK